MGWGNMGGITGETSESRQEGVAEIWNKDTAKNPLVHFHVVG